MLSPTMFQKSAIYPMPACELQRYVLLALAFAEEDERPDETDVTLEDAARLERDYLRRKLQDELNREPTEEELSEWLRQHTEGY